MVATLSPSPRTINKTHVGGTPGLVFGAIDFVTWPMCPTIIDLLPGDGKWLKTMAYRLGCELSNIVALCNENPPKDFAFTQKEQDSMVQFYDVYADGFKFGKELDICLAIGLLDGRTEHQVQNVMNAIREARPSVVLWQTNERPAKFGQIWKDCKYRVVDVVRPAIWRYNLEAWSVPTLDVRVQEGLFMCVPENSGFYGATLPNFASNFVLHPSRLLPPPNKK